jgi:2-hydroxy-3-oxopropionate reductase
MGEKIGFIGVGIMGKPMATNLIRAGHKLVAYDIRSEPLEELGETGAAVADSVAGCVSEVKVVISMLPDSPDVQTVYLGEDGVLAGVKPGTTLVDMSTIAPAVAIEVAREATEKGCSMLDAPVSGGDVGAREGKLSIMVGGEKDTFKRMQPIFAVMGKSTFCGSSGAGQTVKACNQILVAVTLLGMAEALVLGAKAGVDPAVVVEVLSGGLARCGVLENRGMRATERDFAPGFKSKFHYKDLNIIRETGRAFGVPLPAAALAHELFGAMVAKGRGELDHSGVMTVIEDLAEIEVRKHS